MLFQSYNLLFAVRIRFSKFLYRVTGLKNLSQLIDRYAVAIVCRVNEAEDCSFEMRWLVAVVGFEECGSGLSVFFQKVAGPLPRTFQQMEVSPTSSIHFVCCDGKRRPLVDGQLHL